MHLLLGVFSKRRSPNRRERLTPFCTLVPTPTTVVSTVVTAVISTIVTAAMVTAASTITTLTVPSIRSAASTTEAMAAPAVTVAPAAPGSDTYENAVIEVTRAIEAHRRTCIGFVVIVAIITHWRVAKFDANAKARSDYNAYLRCCSTDEHR